MIKNIFHKLNKNLGVLIFNNPNNLYYCFFNYLFKKKIIKNLNKKDIADFKNQGFISPKIDLRLFCEFLQNEIKKQAQKKNDKGYSYFKINEIMRKKIKEIIDINFKETLKDLEQYFNGKIFVGDVRISRNYNLDHVNKNDKLEEIYSNFFHVDHYTYNYFKLFINISDVNENNGPLHYLNIADTKSFVKKSNYSSRNNYKDIIFKKINKNTGKSGKSLIVSTTECIHRAGIPDKDLCRDVLFITFVVAPKNKYKSDNFFYFENSHYESIWNNRGLVTKKFAKPKSLSETLKLYREFKTH
mgnify:FL=1|tara:strand:- start:410 stop:1309 length:900 start_codon:yes stop_codon:yes gene_type:complete